jgi:hypothetical protein
MKQTSCAQLMGTECWSRAVNGVGDTEHGVHEQSRLEWIERVGSHPLLEWLPSNTLSQADVFRHWRIIAFLSSTGESSQEASAYFVVQWIGMSVGSAWHWMYCLSQSRQCSAIRISLRLHVWSLAFVDLPVCRRKKNDSCSVMSE